MVKKSRIVKKVIWFHPRKKFVKKANMWCRTYWFNNLQKVEWFKEQPDLDVPIYKEE